MRIRNLGYVFRLAFQGIFRNGFMSFASILVLICCLVVTGSTYVLTENITYNIDQLSGYNKIVCFVKEDAAEFELASLQEKIEKIGNVSEVRLITKDEALKSYEEEYGDFSYLFDMFEEDNPLKDSFEVTYKEGISLKEINTLVNSLENLEEDGIVKINNRQDITKKLDDLKNVISIVLTWLTILLFVISFFVVMNTIRLSVFSRREEIAIMHYVGATRFFVALPFLIEGTVLGLFSAAIAYGVQYFLYGALSAEVLGIGENGFVTVLPFEKFQWILAIIFAAVSVATGLVAGFAALRGDKKK